MTTENCIFCKIARGEVDSFKVWENSDFLAFLDIFPNTEGMTVVIPKEHFGAQVFDMPKDVYNNFLESAKEVALLLQKSFNAVRVFMVKEGAEVNHAHIKLCPVKDKNVFLKDILIRMPEKQNQEELEKIAKKIRGSKRL